MTCLLLHRFFLLLDPVVCRYFLLHFFIVFIVFFSFRITVFCFYDFSLCYTSHFVQVLFSWFYWTFFIFSDNRLLSFLKITILNSLSGKLQMSISWSHLTLLSSHLKDGYFFQSLLVTFRRKVSSVNSGRDSEVFSDSSPHISHSLCLFPSLPLSISICLVISISVYVYIYISISTFYRLCFYGEPWVKQEKDDNLHQNGNKRAVERGWILDIFEAEKIGFANG